MLLNRSAAVGLKEKTRGLNKQCAFGTCLYPLAMTKKNISLLYVVIVDSYYQSARKNKSYWLHDYEGERRRERESEKEGE